MALVALAVMTLLIAGCAPAAAPGDPEPSGEKGSPTPTSSVEQFPTQTPTSSVEQFPTQTPTSPAKQPTATPKPSTPVPQAPPGDCWDGALWEEWTRPEGQILEGGILCYVLEQSQSDGVIKVEAIYEAPNDVLHIFIDRREPLDTQLSGLFREKANEYLGEGEELHAGAFPWGEYTDGTVRGRMPLVKGYIQVFLHIGGAEAVRSQPGWASWTQLWPSMSVWVRHDPGPGRTFDVSDVDTGNIPEPDCVELLEFSRVGCEIWKRDPDSGIAGFASDSHRTGDKFLAYMQIKEILLPASEDEQETLKQRLLPGYDEDSLDIELIPVKYDFWSCGAGRPS